MRKLYTCILCALVSATAAAQTTPLEGTPIGSTSVDYSTGNPSTTVNSPANAFDDDFSTIFASYERSYTWVGLDLGEKHVITKVAYAPRAGYEGRMLLGVFEGANSPDFTDAVPIYMIKNTPKAGVLTAKYTRVSRGFRYVRYVGPNDARCNVAELKFYGHKGEGSDTRFYTATNLPLVSIHTDSAKEVTQKIYYLPGIISIASNNGSEFFSDSLGIRGRGNGSWPFPKKPYKIKLNNKARLLGMPAKAKKWTLINNYGDKTLVRNLLAFRISEIMGMEYTPAGRLVDVMFNGEYKGTYQLNDQVEVKKHRVNVTELTPDDNEAPEVTGGYLIEIDAYAYEEKKNFTTKYYNLPVSLKYPDADDVTAEQFQYIQDYTNRLTNVVNNGIYNEPKVGFRRFLDEDSFIKRFLIEELAANVDALWSVHMYKERDSTRFHVGPIWDFDLAFENDVRLHPVKGQTDWAYLHPNSTSAGNMRDFVTRIIGVEGDRMRQLWGEARYYGGLTIENLNAFLDSMQTEAYESQKLNFTRWPIMNQIVNQNYQVTGSYEGEMQVVRDFLAYRLLWMDDKLGIIPVGIDGVKTQTIAAAPVVGGAKVCGLHRGDRIVVYDLSGAVVREAEAEGSEAFLPLEKGIYIIDAGAAGRKKVAVR